VASRRRGDPSDDTAQPTAPSAQTTRGGIETGKLQAALEIAQREIAQLKEDKATELQSAKIEAAELRVECDDLKRKWSHMESEHARKQDVLRADIDSLTITLREAEDKHRAVCAERDGIAVTVTQLREEILQSKELSAQLQDRNKAQQEELASLSRAVAEGEKAPKTAEADPQPEPQLEKLETHLEQLNSLLDQKHEVKLETLRQLPMDKLQALSQFAQLRHDIDEDRAEFEKQMEPVHQDHERIVTLVAEVKMLERVLTETKAQFGDAIERNETLKAATENKNRECQALEESLGTLKQDFEEKDATIALLQAQIDAAKDGTVEVPAEDPPRTISLLSEIGKLGIKFRQCDGENTGPYVVVDLLREDGAAAHCGLQVDDIVLAVNDSEDLTACDVNSLTSVLNEKCADGEAVAIEVAQMSTAARIRLAKRQCDNQAYEVVQQWQDAHDAKQAEIERLHARVAELTADLTSGSSETVAVQKWRAGGGRIEIPDDSRDDEHARAMTLLQNDVAALETSVQTARAERDTACYERDTLKEEVADVRAAHKKWLIKVDRESAALTKAREDEVVKLKVLAHQQAVDNDRLRKELREITRLMEEKEGIDDLERQLGSQVGEHSSIDEIRAVLSSVQLARETERLGHLRELSKVHALHSRIAVEIAEARAIDKHQHAMEARATEIQHLLHKAKEVKDSVGGHTKAALIPAHSPMLKSGTQAATEPLRRGYTGLKMTGTRRRKSASKAPADIALSKARTDLVLVGLKPTPRSGKNRAYKTTSLTPQRDAPDPNADCHANNGGPNSTR